MTAANVCMYTSNPHTHFDFSSLVLNSWESEFDLTVGLFYADELLGLLSCAHVEDLGSHSNANTPRY